MTERVCYIVPTVCPCDPEDCDHPKYTLYAKDGHVKMIVGRADEVWWLASKVSMLEDLGYKYLRERYKGDR